MKLRKFKQRLLKTQFVLNTELLEIFSGLNRAAVPSSSSSSATFCALASLKIGAGGEWIRIRSVPERDEGFRLFRFCLTLVFYRVLQSFRSTVTFGESCFRVFTVFFSDGSVMSVRPATPSAGGWW